MASPWAEKLGISLRQLQVLRILWDAEKPILRSQLLARFHDLFAEPIEDATLRGILSSMDERNLLKREPAPREPGTMGRGLTLYSARQDRGEVIPAVVEGIFSGVLGDDLSAIEIALNHLKRRLDG